MSKKLNKEKDLVPACLKTIINSCAVTVLSSIDKEARFEKLIDKKDECGDFSFLDTDFELLNDIYSIYKVLMKTVMMQLKFVFEAPFKNFNSSTGKTEVQLEDLFRDLFFNKIFSIPLTVKFLNLKNSKICLLVSFHLR